jgi:hypothetical protein
MGRGVSDCQAPQAAPPFEPPSPVPLPPVPAVFALSERGGKKGLCYPAFPPTSGFPVRTISRPLFLEKIGKVDPVPCPTFQGRRFDRPDVGWLSKNGSRKVRRENKAYRPA